MLFFLVFFIFLTSQYCNCLRIKHTKYDINLVYDHLQANFGPQDFSLDEYKIVLASPTHGCYVNTNVDYTNKIVIVSRSKGMCYFVERAKNLQDMGAKALVLSASNDDKELFKMVAPDDKQFKITIPCITISYQAYIEISTLYVASKSRLGYPIAILNNKYKDGDIYGNRPNCPGYDHPNAQLIEGTTIDERKKLLC